ncbi:MAG: TIGR04255 family protein [Candidatus Heimdallarchaeota archaeon]|nr:TIGR04255 family protein [Candidatus Heimdallarchaeota archaeon]
MKMPQFTKTPPLVSFRLDLQFENPLQTTFENMAKIEAYLKDQYQNVTELTLVGLNVPVDFPLKIGPIRFLAREKDHEINFFSNGIVFIFKKYTHWEEVKKQVLDSFQKIKEIFDIGTINQLRMEYLDDFDLPAEGFDIKNYFSLSLNKNEDWDLDYSDFHIGIKFQTENNHKIIYRLRGIKKIEEQYKIRLESLYLAEVECSVTRQLEELNEQLDLIHGKISNYFWSIMTKKTKDLYGVIDE